MHHFVSVHDHVYTLYTYVKVRWLNDSIENRWTDSDHIVIILVNFVEQDAKLKPIVSC